MSRRLGLAGVVALTFVIPWEDTLTLPGMGTLARLVGIVAFGMGVLAVVLRGRLRRPSLGWGLMLVFVALAGLSQLWTLDPVETHDRFWTYAQLAAMVWLVGEFAPDEASQRRVFLAYVLGALVSIGATWSAYAAGRAVTVDRYAATGFNPNDLAFILALGIPMAWRLGTEAPRPALRALGLLYPALALLTVILTASRGGFLLSLLALAVVPSTWRALGGGTRAGVLGAAALSLVAISSLAPASSLDRIHTIGREITEGSLNARSIIWMAGLQVFVHEPILGVGAGSFPVAVQPILGAAMHPHNVYLSVLVDQGLLGFGVFAGILGVAVHAARRMGGVERRTWMVLLLVLLVGFLSTNWEWRKQTWLLLGLLLARSPLR